MSVDWPSFWLGVFTVYWSALMLIALLMLAVDIADWHAARKHRS